MVMDSLTRGLAACRMRKCSGGERLSALHGFAVAVKVREKELARRRPLLGVEILVRSLRNPASAQFTSAAYLMVIRSPVNLEVDANAKTTFDASPVSGMSNPRRS